MKKVMITGIGGAIGVHVLAHLMHNTDWEVVGIDSFRHKGEFDRITRVCRDHPEWPDRIRIFTHDLCAPLTQREIFQIGTIDYIINLAARSDVKASNEDPVSFIKNNTDLMLNILEYAREVKPKVFIHFSTDEVYGPTPMYCPVPHYATGLINDKIPSGGHKEWDPIVPSNPYSASEACQEAICIAWWRYLGLPLIITNTMNNFGEMQAPSKFPAMIQTKLQNDEIIPVHVATSGEVGTRYYIHSRNTADALLFILNNVPPIHHAYGEIDRPVRLNIVGDKAFLRQPVIEAQGEGKSALWIYKELGQRLGHAPQGVVEGQV